MTKEEAEEKLKRLSHLKSRKFKSLRTGEFIYIIDLVLKNKGFGMWDVIAELPPTQAGLFLGQAVVGVPEIPIDSLLNESDFHLLGPDE